MNPFSYMGLYKREQKLSLVDAWACRATQQIELTTEISKSSMKCHLERRTGVSYL